MYKAHNWTTDEMRTLDNIAKIEHTFFEYLVTYTDGTTERFATYCWDLFPTK